MGRFGVKLVACAMSVAMLFSGASIPGRIDYVEAAEEAGENQIEVRECEKTKAAAGNIIVELEGMDYTSDMQEMLDRINQVRKEACESGEVPDPRDKNKPLSQMRKLSVEDYVPLKMGVNCTKVAQIRAAEGSLKFSHTRPVGEYDNRRTYGVDLLLDMGALKAGENLAWKTIKSSDLDQWIKEKNDWIAQVEDPSKPTGHYATLVNPNYSFMGISTFNPENDTYIKGWSCTAGAFAAVDTEVDNYASQKSEKVIQKIEIPAADVTSIDIVGDVIQKVGDSKAFKPYVSAELTSVELGKSNNVYDMPVCDGISWSSSDPSVLKIDSNGITTAMKAGTAMITATIGSGDSAKSVSRECAIVPEGVVVSGVNNPEKVFTESCTQPVLNKTVEATLSDGTVLDVNVDWDIPNDIDDLLETYFTDEEFDITGKALGFDVTQTVHVNAAEIVDVYPTNIKDDYYVPGKVPMVYTYSGTVPEYFDNYRYNKNAASAVFVFSNQWALCDYPIDWNEEEINSYCDSLQGGTFTVHGTVSVQTKAGLSKIPVEQKLMVYSATVEEVTIDNSPIETTSGKEPKYPKARVKWSSGDITDESITWEETEDFKNGYKREAGTSYVIKGSYKGPDGTEKSTGEITVNVVSIVAQEIRFDQTNINVTNGTYPALPEKAMVYWSDGTVEEKTIEWEPIPVDKYKNVDGGTFVAKGSVAGKEVSVSFIVPKASITSIETFNQVETVEGKAPAFPSTVKVQWDNGLETDEKVIWNSIEEDDYKTPGTTKTVTGTIKDREENVQITFVVNAKKLKALGWANPKPNSEGNPSGLISYGSYDIDKLSGTLVAYFDNDTQEEIDIRNEEVSMIGYDDASLDKTQEITFSYSFGGVTKSAKATLQLKPKKVDSITVSELPIQKHNDVLNLSGVVVEATYNSGETSRLDLGTLVNRGRAEITGYDLSVAGRQTVEIIYHAPYKSLEDPLTDVENDIKISAYITVKDVFVSDLRIVSKPESQYIIGQPVDFSVLKVKVIYDDDTSEEIGYNDFAKNDIRINDFDPSKLGDQTFTIRKDDKSVKFVINIVDKQITKAYFTIPDKTAYLQGQMLSMKGSSLHVEYDNNIDVEDILVDDDLKISGSEIKILVKDDMGNVLMSGGYDDIGRLAVGTFNISLSYKNQAIELYNGQKLVSGYTITVKAPATNSSASVSADDLGDITSDATLEDMKNAFSGVSISVPCKGDDSTDIVVTKDMVEDVRDVTEANATNAEKSLLTQVSEDQVIKKIKIAITEDTAGNTVYTYVYIAVDRKKSSEEGSGENGSGENDSENGGNSSSGENGSGSNGSNDNKTDNGTGGNGSDDKSSENGNGGNSSETGDNGKEGGAGGSSTEDRKTTESPDKKADEDSRDTEEGTAKVGSVVTSGGAKYKVTASNSVSYKAPTKASATGVVVPASVKINGKVYKVTTVEANAFKGNTKLTKVVIGKNVQTVGKNAFAGCTNLTTVTFGSNVTTIGDGAFSGCKKLTKVVIPGKVKKIGKKAFYKCTNLKKIIIKTKKLGKKSIGANAFKGINKKAAVSVPKAKKKAYTKYLRKAGLPKNSKIK